MDDAIINRCVSLLSLLWYEGGDIAKEATMSCYIGYHALALMYLHAETKCWLDEVQGSNHESQAGQSNLICSFLEKKETALTAIDTWLHNNSYAKVLLVSKLFCPLTSVCACRFVISKMVTMCGVTCILLPHCFMVVALWYVVWAPFLWQTLCKVQRTDFCLYTKRARATHRCSAPPGAKTKRPKHWQEKL